MKDHDSTIGITLAELAFFLVFAVIFVVAIQAHGSPEEHEGLQQQVTDLEKEKQELQQEVTDLEVHNAELQSLRPIETLRSTAKPNCTEAGIINAEGPLGGFLFNVTITGRDAYILEYPDRSVTLPLKGILARYESDLADAEQAECVHRINVRRMPGYDLDDYLHALTMLDQYFYTARR